MAAEDWLPPGWEAAFELYTARKKPKNHVNGCKGVKVIRVNKKTGEEFYGCSEWPKCKWSRNL